MSGLDERIRDRIRQGQAPDSRAIADVLAAQGPQLGVAGLAVETGRLAAATLGLGELEQLVADPQTTDVLVNGDGTVWADRGGGLDITAVRLGSSEEVRRLAVRLAGIAGRRLDESQPWVDGLLPGGVRLHAMLPPLVDGGAHISLRVPRARGLTLGDLAGTGMLCARGLEVVQALVERKVSFVVTGGTGSGKTTLLAAMLGLVPADERVLVVEDVRELAVGHPHVVRLQARHPNVEGLGEVTMVQLVRQALRMRPDRVVVGEVRGAEVRELLAALNTGHEGGCGTLHANSPLDVPARFEALGALAGMAREAVHAQLASAVDVVLHVTRRPGGRVLESVSVLTRRDVLVRAEVAAEADSTGRLVPAAAWSALAGRLALDVRPGGGRHAG
ncbi:MAG: TadA family conjugal transfer-associated ATPase [Micrococcales bacterium]|nr:TadA family conjugal transfer-associated ATPase [Micrococcales bacterium]